MNLQFWIEIKDMVSGGLIAMARQARQTGAAIKGGNDTIAMSYDTIRKKIRDIEESIGKSSSLKFIRDQRIELQKLQALARSAPGNLSRIASAWSPASLMGGFAGMLRQALPIMSIAGALHLGGTVIGEGLQAQARQTSFEVLAGKEAGGLLNKDLTKFAQDSIYGAEVFQNAQTMLGFGAQVKEVMPDMKMLGDIAMGNKDRLGRLTLAFSQARAAGKLMGQDLLQFINAGFNPLQIMSQRTGISIGDLRKKMEEGEITFEMVKDAFIAATSAGGNFHNMLSKIEKTDFGKWEAFRGQMSGLAMQLGGIVAPAFGEAVSGLAGMVTTLQKALTPEIDKANQAFKDQQEHVELLNTEILPIIERYGELKEMASLNTSQHDELNEIIKKLTEIMPEAATGWNEYGEAISFSTDLMREQIALSKEGLAWRNKERIKLHEEKAKDELMQLHHMLLELNRGTKVLKGTGGIGATSQLVPLSEKEKVDLRNSIAEIRGGIQMTINEMRAMSGEAPQRFALRMVQNPDTGEFDQFPGLDKLFKSTKGMTLEDVMKDIGYLQNLLPDDEDNTKKQKLSDSHQKLKDDHEADATARLATSGGPRVININGVKFMERFADKIELHNMGDVKELEELMTEKFQELYLRVLNSGAKVQ